MTVVAQWWEADHHFLIEQLDVPVLKGAQVRTHRLYCDGEPASGGQWHHSEESARWRAGFIAQCTWSARVRYLENRVVELERELRERA